MIISTKISWTSSSWPKNVTDLEFLDQRIRMPVQQKNHSGPTSMQHHTAGMNLGLSAPQKSVYITRELKREIKTTMNKARV